MSSQKNTARLSVTGKRIPFLPEGVYEVIIKRANILDGRIEFSGTVTNGFAVPQKPKSKTNEQTTGGN